MSSSQSNNISQDVTCEHKMVTWDDIDNEWSCMDCGKVIEEEVWYEDR